jgi:integrase
MLVYIGQKLSGSLVTHMLTRQDQFFAILTRDGEVTPLTHRLFVETLRSCLQKIGVNPSEFSGHSFRRGGVTFAYRMGVPPLLIKLMGDWSSDVYMTYIDHTTPSDLARLPRALTKTIAAMA